MLGLFERTPRFVKRFDDLGGADFRRGRDLCRRGAVAQLSRRGADLRPQGLSAASVSTRRRAAKVARLSALIRRSSSLAVPPNTNEAFLREVDEELRRDQLVDVWRRYGTLAIVAASSPRSRRSAAGSAGSITARQRAGAEGEQLLQARMTSSAPASTTRRAGAAGADSRSRSAPAIARSRCSARPTCCSRRTT